MDDIIDLYRQLAEHTKAKCDECPNAGRPYRCCEGFACELAQFIAETRWGVSLAPTGHATLALMGPSGCVAAPHFRPACTGHVCPETLERLRTEEPEWLARYFELRQAIHAAEQSYQRRP